ncbi:hypothetical protein GCM10025734_02070 [Kitasatospora paranensis]|uniref:TadE/TadG family type IV pilus assembly protein n=1 Tax=Kitasatospora paranensis TaxID=258053 RepID=UPI0031EE6E5E
MMRRLRRLIERRRTQGRDSGMSSVEFVIGTPIIFGLLFLAVQFALFFFADQVALASAQAGARRPGPPPTQTPAAGRATPAPSPSTGSTPWAPRSAAIR